MEENVPRWLPRRSDGERSGTWLLAIICCLAFQVPLLLGGSEWSQEKGLVLRIPTPEAMGAAAFVAAVGAYLFRRHKSKPKI